MPELWQKNQNIKQYLDSYACSMMAHWKTDVLRWLLDTWLYTSQSCLWLMQWAIFHQWTIESSFSMHHSIMMALA